VELVVPGDGAPAIVMNGEAGSAGRMAIYPGLVVSVGSMWIIVETASQSANVTASVLVSVEIWRKQRQKEGPKAGE
jgi:hypothetical protein